MEQEHPYHRDDLKSELIEKGLRLLDEEGYEAFSLRKVAKACNVSHTAPYRHFKDKDELIGEIAFETLRKFEYALQEAAGRYPDEPSKQLREMGCAYVEFFLENPAYLRLIFFNDIGKKVVERRLQAAGCGQACDFDPFAVLYKTVLLYRAKSTSPLAAMDPNALLLFCWGLVHGISVLVSRGEFPYAGDYRALTRQIFWSDAVLF